MHEVVWKSTKQTGCARLGSLDERVLTLHQIESGLAFTQRHAL